MHTGDEPGDALTAVRCPAPDFSLAREDEPIFVDGPEAAGAAHHPRRHGRVDHVAVRPVHQVANISPKGERPRPRFRRWWSSRWAGTDARRGSSGPSTDCRPCFHSPITFNLTPWASRKTSAACAVLANVPGGLSGARRRKPPLKRGSTTKGTPNLSAVARIPSITCSLVCPYNSHPRGSMNSYAAAARSSAPAKCSSNASASENACRNEIRPPSSSRYERKRTVLGFSWRRRCIASRCAPSGPRARPP